MDQGGTDSFHLVGAYGCTDPATADGNTALDFACDNRVSERNHEIGIIVTRIQTVCTEVYDLVATSTKLGNQFFLQAKSTVVSGNADLHMMSFSLVGCGRRLICPVSAPPKRIRP